MNHRDDFDPAAVCQGPPAPKTLAEQLELAEQERDRAGHALHVALQLVSQLKGLVGDAFQEGFQRRDPDHDEPWLIDWLQSDSKRTLDALFTIRDAGGDER